LQSRPCELGDGQCILDYDTADHSTLLRWNRTSSKGWARCNVDEDNGKELAHKMTNEMIPNRTCVLPEGISS
jgi:hypothetical protein